MINGCQIKRTISIDRLHTFFRSDFKKDYVFGGEKHDFWEIVFVLAGTVGIIADSDIYVLEKGQAVIHCPGEFHKIWSEFDTNPTVIVLSFSAEYFPFSGERILSLDTSSVKKLEELYELSLECFKREGIAITEIKDGADLRVEYFRLNAELLLYSLIHRQSRRAGGGLRSAELYSAAVRIMEEAPDAGFCIDDIAERCSISPAYLKKIFVRYAGCSVMQYYNRLRARIACGHLDNGRSVKETALLLGFADQNYFSTFFKRIIGVSPTEFKKHINK